METVTAARVVSRVKFTPSRKTDFARLYQLKGSVQKTLKFFPYPHFEKSVCEETLFEYRRIVPGSIMNEKELDEMGFVYNGTDVCWKAEVTVFYNDGGESYLLFKTDEEALKRFKELMETFGLKLINPNTALPIG